MAKQTYEVIRFGNETSTALTVEVLSKTFPNVEFEGVEVGDGSYKIQVQSKYQDFIHPHTMEQFISQAVKAHQIVSIIIARLKAENMLLKIE